MESEQHNSLPKMEDVPSKEDVFLCCKISAILPNACVPVVVWLEQTNPVRSDSGISLNGPGWDANKASPHLHKNLLQAKLAFTWHMMGSEVPPAEL